MKHARFGVDMRGEGIKEIGVSPSVARTPKQRQLDKLKSELVMLIGLLIVMGVLFVRHDRRVRSEALRQVQPPTRVGTVRSSLREEFPDPQTFR